MAAKRVVITGPTSGIGSAIARALADEGAQLVLACRDGGKGQQLIDEIRRRQPASELTVMQIDTSSQASIRRFAQAYRERYGRLDVLVNNAGISKGVREISVDGLEMTFATNVLGYWLLTQELLETLVAAAPARIVNVASAFVGDLDLDDLQFERRPFDGLRAYAQSKACNRLLTWALARRLQGSNVTANAYAPGFVAGTGLQRDLPPDIKEAYRRRPGRSFEEGADTAVWLATSRDVEGLSGKMFMDRREMTCELGNVAVEEALWRTCERLTGAPPS